MSFALFTRFARALLCSIRACAHASVFRTLPCFSQMCFCAVSPPEPIGSLDQARCWTSPQQASHPSWTQPWTTPQTAVWCLYLRCRLIGRLWLEEARLWSDWLGKSKLKRRRKWLAVLHLCKCVLYCVLCCVFLLPGSSYSRISKHIKSLLRCK